MGLWPTRPNENHVVPAKAGTHSGLIKMDSRVRGNDASGAIFRELQATRNLAVPLFSRRDSSLRSG